MSLLANLTSKIFGGKGTGTSVNNAMVMSQSTYGSELYSLLAGSTTGVAVTEKQAMQVSAVYASVGLIGGAVASLPLHVYKRARDGRERYDSDLWWLFNESPHPAWTSAAAWQFTMQSILLKGDSFWVIERPNRYSPEVQYLRPVHPDNVIVEFTSDGNLYHVNTDGEIKSHYAVDVLHFSGLGFDGVRSMTPIQYALRTAAGTSLAADKYSAGFFSGGARPDHALVVPAEIKLTAEQKETIKQTWGKQRDAFLNQGMTPVLTGGMDVKALTLNAQDSQLLETRQFGVEEIARIFGVPPHMIGKTDASTSWGSGIEQMSIGFVRYTLRRHIDVIQQEINRKMWPKSRMFFAEFNTDALLDGDSKAQADYFSKALGGPGAQGWMTVNEIRKLKNMKPIDGGDELIKAGQSSATDPAQQQAQGTP